MDPNSHRSPLELSYYDAFELRHFVISELQTSALFVKSLFVLLLEKVKLIGLPVVPVITFKEKRVSFYILRIDS